MIELRIEEAKSNFFDRLTVSAAEERARLRNLSKLGAFIRTRARSSMRRRQGIADAGEPPSAHVGLLKLIYFAFDSSSGKLVVGPLKLNTRTPLEGFPGTLPELMEGGGDVLGTLAGKERTKHYRPHPFMQPAMEAELAKVPDLWTATVRK